MLSDKSSGSTVKGGNMMGMKKIIVRKIMVMGGDCYARPFRSLGVIVDPYTRLEEVDLIVFTGGEDVTPSLYGEKSHPYTSSNWKRDSAERLLYLEALEKGIPMVGICRGSQFLNVMNGGKLLQHIPHHGVGGTHPMYTINNEEMNVTSTHHQMSVLKDDAELIAWAFEVDGEEVDVEVFFYPKSLCLGVQYHPEYMEKDSRGYTYFQELLEEYVL